MSQPAATQVFRLVLGTVQLGTPYGIANTHGQPDAGQAQEIIQTAFAGGVRCFDTAEAYGNSEEVLGACLSKLGYLDEARVISKPSAEFSAKPNELIEALGLSLAKIGVKKLEAFLFHREEHLALLNEATAKEAKMLLQNGLTKGFGISVYSPEAALNALANPLINALQVPASVLDHRFANALVFAKAKELNKRIYVRSAFLQGLICMDLQKIPAHLSPIKNSIASYRKLCADYGFKPEAVAIAWLLEQYPQAYILFGAETPEQVQENISSLPKDPLPAEMLESIAKLFPEQNPAILNPALWQR